MYVSESVFRPFSARSVNADMGMSAWGWVSSNEGAAAMTFSSADPDTA